MSKLILIKNFPNRMFAEMAQQLLKAKEIPSIIKAPDYGFPGAAAGGGSDIFSGNGVDLYVEEEFAERAEEIVREQYDGI
jgi:hypothetical protein